ncbi:class I SAM-dependent methyltransferase [Jiella sp. M17.18]|uniref:class I SAM-dependent methyltransferase n=1 Tax=Jiella sp. M17.18 TaxID=3234247 RepID=UPI0034DFFE6F
MERFTFIDIGCGMGRPLCIAARCAFRRVVGVELSPMLAQQAERNAAAVIRFGKARCDNGHIVNQNAIDFELPYEDCVIFLFNPFDAEILARVLANIEERVRDGHKIYFIHQNPVHRSVLQASRLLRPLPIAMLKSAVIGLLTPGHRALYECPERRHLADQLTHLPVGAAPSPSGVGATCRRAHGGPGSLCRPIVRQPPSSTVATIRSCSR